MPHPAPPNAAPPTNPGTNSFAGTLDIIARLERERRHCLERARGETAEGEAPPAHYAGRALAYGDAVRLIREAGLSGPVAELLPLDFDRMLAAIEARGTALARAMPDEAAALRVLDTAYERLKALGFRAALYCPKDGKARQFIEAGSLGIHVGHREADGTVWLADGGDLWASNPILFREMPVLAASATTGATP
ncbi:hypothetical protein PUR29_36425 [Methylobacterium ajmalii]|uniref:Uncharacterized protein n=1 Tax=Methylobacterium ajmalii TaxID=2738439 RepID=A0ABV0A510_9HYPH